MKVTKVTCDICGRLLLPSENEMPRSYADHYESIQIRMCHNTEHEAYWDLCPKCQKRMIRYLKKYGSEFDKEDSNEAR